jgi:hypothetical protein
MTIKNRKKEYQPIKKISNGNVIVMWDYQPILSKNSKGEEVETPLATWQEKRFTYTPTLDEIKTIILDYYNSEINNKILSEFYWKGMSVWLSNENQLNYKTIYDIAIQTKGENLPVVFKFGNSDNPQYYAFKTLDELSEFYLGSVAHIQRTLREGWQKKDSINWEVYSEKLN